MADYDVTVGGRLNSVTTKIQAEGVDSVPTLNGHSEVVKGAGMTNGYSSPPSSGSSHGLKALTSCPNDNYSYYAKTCIGKGRTCYIILVYDSNHAVF